MLPIFGVIHSLKGLIMNKPMANCVNIISREIFCGILQCSTWNMWISWQLYTPYIRMNSVLLTFDTHF